MPEIHSRLDHKQAEAILTTLPALLSGHAPDPTGLVRQLQLALGVQAISLVRQAFVTKSRGGTDEAGITWKPLDQRYVAYGRRHPGLKRKKPGERPRGLLTAKQDERWRKIFAMTYRVLRTKGMPDEQARGNAAANAWNVLKAEGAKTILDTYGKAPVEIGRDTGRLLNSLSPGVGGASGNADQVFRTEPGAVIVGTNVKYAAPFHARRPLWPKDDQWPKVWLDHLESTLFAGVEILLRRLVA
ncbi:MAG: hypothetical protein KGL39_07930 [Patescibacteria group bacterium]|nr:hypothetical protein [Patescibacteria group bacterium]